LADSLANDEIQASVRQARGFLSYLYDWYYKELSSTSHLSYPGLILRSKVLLLEQDDQGRADDLIFLRSYFFFQTVGLVLALLSEVQSEAMFSFADRLKYVWRIVNEYSPDCREIYSNRYESLL
jgi:hypothetical protein